MGGGAFTKAVAAGQPTLNTPRISKDDYQRIKPALTKSLHAFFGAHTRLDTLREAPEKADHGDIDFLVAHSGPVEWLQLATSVGAAGMLSTHAGICTLAVPMDGTRSPHPPVVYKHIDDNKPGKLRASEHVTPEEYAHVDIDLADPAIYAWRTFYGSYGDMGNILGRILRNVGFMISHIGLTLRLKELGDMKRSGHQHNIADKDGMVLLSDDPGKVMHFMGLSSDKHEAGFETLDELYAWIGHCRFLSADTAELRRDKADDRVRERTRPIFTRFFNEWVPAHVSQGDNDCTSTPSGDDLRIQLAKEAVAFFDRQAEYDAVHTKLIRSIANSTTLQLLRPVVQKHSGADKAEKVNEILRALQRFVSVSAEDMHTSVLETPHGPDESELHRLLMQDEEERFVFRDEGKVDAFVGQHWSELRTLERTRVKMAKEKRSGKADGEAQGEKGP